MGYKTETQGHRQTTIWCVPEESRVVAEGRGAQIYDGKRLSDCG